MPGISPQGAGWTPEDDTSYTPEFRKLLQILKEKMELYEAAKERAKSDPNNADHRRAFSKAVDELRDALLNAARDHPDKKTGKKWKAQAQNLSTALDEEQESALKEIGTGLAMIILSPIALAGLAVYSAGVIVAGVAYTTGGILNGVGSLLKGIGKAGKKALVPDD